MFGPTRASPERTAMVRAVKGWARDALGLSDDTIIMATELRCTEPGCPPLETVIAVMHAGGDKQQFKLHKALTDLVYEDIAAGAARMLRGESHEHVLPGPEDGTDEVRELPTAR